MLRIVKKIAMLVFSVAVALGIESVMPIENTGTLRYFILAVIALAIYASCLSFEWFMKLRGSKPTKIRKLSEEKETVAGNDQAWEVPEARQDYFTLKERSLTAQVEGEDSVNRDKFKVETEKLSGGLKVDSTKMEKWFEGTLGMLDSLGRQKESIRHPGHRGSSREKPLLDLLEEMLPSSLVVLKGIALNALMAESKEQDILIVDRNVAGAILPGRSRYFPIECCLASIQVKSRLTRATIRHAAVNCVSLKSLGMFDDEAPWTSKNHGVCFGVFAYRSNYGLAKLAEVVNEELKSVKRDLWPNIFYVVGEGMLIPADDQARIPMDNETMFTGSKFCTVGDMGLVPTIGRSRHIHSCGSSRT